MLIPSERHKPADLELWAEMERADRVHASHSVFRHKVERALEDIQQFTRAGKPPCYAGVSWGKDSTVLAHLIARCLSPRRDLIPVVWIKVEPIFNPDCRLVEDAFLEAHYIDYHCITTHCCRDLLGWHATGTLEQGFAEAVRRFGGRHISGVRAEESGERKLRGRKWGVATRRTLAPLIWWSAQDVYAYLAVHQLPVHPAYAMLGGGRWERDRLRVASLGGRRGDGRGRAEWEQEYYGDVLNALRTGPP